MYFQSHYGLILSGIKGVNWIIESLTFNPTMVWFYLISKTVRASSRCFTFNPTMVWFYLYKFNIPRRTRKILSIPLWSDFISLPLLLRRCKMSPFNPTMVWFYRRRQWQSLYRNILFQSHYGLILSGTYVPYPVTIEEPFNPTMVWFYLGCKAVWHWYRGILSIPLWSDFILKLFWNHIFEQSFFQSHYGLILSRAWVGWDTTTKAAFNPTMVWFYRCSISNSSNVHEDLSIPLWSDFITTVRYGRLMSLAGFQSHYGLILSRVQTSTDCSNQWLSIPLWSDFIDMRKRVRIHVLMHFQSHYGLILSEREDWHPTMEILPFNPTMVWFYPLSQHF